MLTAIQSYAMAQSSREFQNRARRSGDDGADFEDFVFECFRIARGERGFSKRLARGRDGAVDLKDQTGSVGAVTIAECKYIGSGAAKDVAGRWAEVFGNLSKNLPVLRQDSSKRANSPYRAWLDVNSPVKYYRFCVTVAMSDAELQSIETRIVADFAKLVEMGVEEVRSLAEGKGAVRVLRWDWFHAELEEHPSLAFRWFRGLPAGVELFDADSGAAATFRDFLTSGELRYFSRDEYVAGGSGKVERGEAALISRLAGQDVTSLLITGPGGVGKTRLSWEIASTFSGPPNGFDVYRLGRSVGFDSVTELAGSYPAEASILLLVDYAEAVLNLAGVADAMAHLNANSSHRIRLVATCRASATNWVNDSLAVLEPDQKSLGSAQSGEKDYAQWVTNSILEMASFPEADDLARICHGIPALAAFALFLFRRHRAGFDGQFGALHGVEDFEKWSGRRIAALSARLGTISGGERDMAQIALTLPFPIDHDNALIRKVQPVLDALLADRWIERDQGDYAAAHDVFADALVARWLFESDHAATGRATDLLTDAASNCDLSHALFALARLAPHPRFGEISGSSVVHALIKLHPVQAENACNILFGGPLLNYEEKLDLLAQWHFLKDRMRDDPTLQVSLSIVAAEAAYRKEGRSSSPELTILAELLDDLCNQPQQSNLVLRRAYAFDPPCFIERVWANIRAFADHESTHFLLVQMLRAGEHIEMLQGPVKTWLESNAIALPSSFVYNAWLDAGGGTEAVSDALLEWVDRHGTSSEARFVCKAWLDAGGGAEAVSDALLAWVEAHGISSEAQFIYDAWLDAGGGTEAVSAALLAWIGAHGGTLEASHVYKAWLDAGGGTEAVSDALLAWVVTHGVSFEAQFVYKAWLDAGGGIDAVSATLFVWVGAHGASVEASHVYKAWLDAGGDFAAIQDPVDQWCTAWSKDQNFVHLSKALSKLHDLPESIALAIGLWCITFPNHEDALSRLGTAIARLSIDKVSAIGHSELLRCVENVLSKRLELTEADKTQLWGLCAALGFMRTFNFAPFGAARCIAEIVRTGQIFDDNLVVRHLPFLAETYSQMGFLVLFCLRNEMLCIHHDHIALSRFSSWLRRSASNSDRILRRLTHEFPSSAWTS